ncbi:cathepsin O [Anoplophora glabripennis]|uniref:cathepsin O n=1 Tax=Anoplophora glabripennis TaxID=217634 RepID=UPI0008740D67|nr:cathepsin O [Anoplophora glabripennis]
MWLTSFTMPNTVERSRKRCCIEFLCCTLLLLFFIPIRIKNLDEEEIQFQNYIATYNKSYNLSEYGERLKAFKHSLENIRQLNLNKTSNTAKYGPTKYSDMLPQEFHELKLLPDVSNQLQRILLPQYFNLNSDEDSSERIKQSVSRSIPEKVDWREKNVVTKVKSQQSCSACWAFAAVGMIESVNAIGSGKLQSLSVQNIIDCAPFDGCDGGNVCALLSWMKRSKFVISKESDYPLTLRNGKCRKMSTEGVHIHDFICKDFVGAEEQILYFLAVNGPVAVAINALSWQHYIGGTIQFHCDGNPSKLNHAVEIVGYDLTKDVPHYIVKNSWGEDFGDNGYLYVAIGKNMCGLAYEVAVAII